MRDPEVPITFTEAIREAQDQLLKRYDDVFIIGEGVPDPKSVFGTCKDLAEKYPTRVFDSPVSEAGVTGVCIGAAVAGLRPIHVHQRMDFSLYAMDQIVNNLAKWKSMFGLNRNLGMTIRMTVGRGWGAGNQHAQNLEALFAHIPGLNVVVPHDPVTAKGLLIAAVESREPTIFIEHKWLHNIKSKVSPEFFSDVSDSHVIVGNPHYANNNVTLVAWGAAAQLAKQAAAYTGAELVILNRLPPKDWDTVFFSVEKTKQLIVVSDAWRTGSFASEVIARVVERFKTLNLDLYRCQRLTLSDAYVPSSSQLSVGYYPDLGDVIRAIGKSTGKEFPEPATRIIPHDVDPNIGKVISAI